MSELDALRALAREMGVHTTFTTGLGVPVEVGPETLLRVCRALGAELETAAGAAEALRALRASIDPDAVPPVIVAWEGVLPEVRIPGRCRAALHLEDGEPVGLASDAGEVRLHAPLPWGYHRLTVEGRGDPTMHTVISAPVKAWRRLDDRLGWGVGTQLAALRSGRSRALADLRDLEALGRWIAAHGGDLVTVLPPLPTFNEWPPEPSPYSATSRLFWDELVLDLGARHTPAPPPDLLRVMDADVEVRSALAAAPDPAPEEIDDELLRYARYRGTQKQLGRNWRDWPSEAREGRLDESHWDPAEVRFHLVAQTTARRQLAEVAARLAEAGVRLGLDLAVGVHADGYDPWSRQSLFVQGMSVGAPPDPGFPSGQDWGFSPVLPSASRAEGHDYYARSIAHQAGPAGVLRIDHIMANTRLYWIPLGMDRHQGTYVDYPAEELFAVLVLESHRNECEILGENLGTVPQAIEEALPRHGIRGMYLAQFEAALGDPPLPDADRAAMIGTHDTPTLAGWVAGVDIDERVHCALLPAEDEDSVRTARAEAVVRLAEAVEVHPADVRGLVDHLLVWLGESDSPSVLPWVEDLWLEVDQVNLPGTRSSERENWQRPMTRLLDDVLADPEVIERVQRLNDARSRARARSANDGADDGIE